MTQQATPTRRTGSVSDKDAATSSSTTTTTRSQTPSRQSQDKKNGSSGGATATANGSRGKSANSRSSSIPKQRGKSSSNSLSAPLAPPPSRYDVALAKMKKQTEGKSEDELQLRLQQLLQSGQFEDAAYLIAASAYLDGKFKTSDVVRLMLDAKQFAQTAQLIRDMKLQANQLLVTLFIKELVRCSQFHAAVRYAQEMVLNFGKKDFGPRDQERPSWTPQALIQAMFRAQQFKTALKFSKQFELLDTFPALPLVASMFEARQWEDAISSVMEYRLFTDFPIEALIMKMLGERQWSLAVKCMGKVQTKELLDKYADALVREAARTGDFVVAVRYLREYKLDQDENKPLMKYLIDSMINYGEMYKAIKYSIKFGLEKNPEDEGNGALQTVATVYDTKRLILRAIEIGQYHVAATYIKKLRLKEHFANELVGMEQKQQARLREFRDFVHFRESQFSHPGTQHQLYTLLGDKFMSDGDMVELEPVVVDVVISEVEEIIPKKKKEGSEQTMESSHDEVSAANFPAKQQQQPSPERAVENASEMDTSPQSSERQSRFNFARTSVPDAAPPGLQASSSLQSNDPSPNERVQAPPPGLAQFTQSAPPRSEASPSSFNFAHFASSLQSSVPASGPGPAPPQPQVQSHAPGMQHMPPPNQPFSHQAPMSNGNFSRGPAPPPQSFPTSYHQGYMQNMNPSQGQPPSFMMPPPPAPPQRTQGVNSPSMDIAALAMQFHSAGAGRGFGAPSFGVNNAGPVNAYPPQMPPPTGSPPALNHLFPSFAPPPPPQFAAPPRSSFKPSIGYTSVTTTVKRK